MSTTAFEFSAAPLAPNDAPPHATSNPTLDDARTKAIAAGLSYAGGISPSDAWDLITADEAVLVDVRTAEERAFVGHIPDTLHVPWATGTALTRNPRFIRELEQKVAKDQVILLLCRSGKRSVLAAEAAAKAGYANAFNILEGFEGEIDALNHRGNQDGWRYRGLPWVQN